MSTAMIGLDCRLSGVQHGGIGRYENEVFSRILTSREYDFTVYLAAESQQEHLSQRLKGDTSHITWRVTPIPHYSLAEQWQWSSLLQQDTLTLLHVPHFNAPVRYTGKTVLTIHDLLWHEQRGARVTTLPAWVYWPKYIAYRYVARKAIEHAARILVPSEVIKSKVAAVVPSASSKIDVTYEGVEKSFKPGSTKRRKKHLLYVGSLYPHKNVQLVLQALKKLRDWQLSIVSARTVFAQRLLTEAQALGVADRVHFLFGVSEEQLIKEYQTCTALVQPSISEGFGLTGVEALACHTPVLASSIPIFAEIYGSHATFFNPHSVESLADAMLHPNAINGVAVDRFLQRYAWDLTAANTLSAYKKALS